LKKISDRLSLISADKTFCRLGKPKAKFRLHLSEGLNEKKHGKVKVKFSLKKPAKQENLYEFLRFLDKAC